MVTTMARKRTLTDTEVKHDDVAKEINGAEAVPRKGRQKETVFFEWSVH